MRVNLFDDVFDRWLRIQHSLTVTCRHSACALLCAVICRCFYHNVSLITIIRLVCVVSLLNTLSYLICTSTTKLIFVTFVSTYHKAFYARFCASDSFTTVAILCGEAVFHRISVMAQIRVSQNVLFRFYRATHMHSADYAVARCLSVCPSVRHTPVLCLNGYAYPQKFFTIG